MIDEKKIREEKNFLGYEFLTWSFLLFDRAGKKDEVVKILNNLLFKTDVSIVLGSRVVTCLFSHREQKTSINCPILEDSHEVFASLKNGHMIEALSLMFLIGEISISFTLHAQDFAFTQIKVKNNFDSVVLGNEEQENEDDALREEMFLRISLLDDTEKVIDALYGHFLKVRANSQLYAQCLKDMRQQIEERLDSYLEKNVEKTKALQDLQSL